MASDIFVSYSSKDRDAVRAIVSSLEREWVVWWDRDLIAGDQYEPLIFKVIAQAPVTLVIVSSSSVVSDWVGREAKEALRLGKKVIPVVVDGTALPQHLQQLNAVDLTDVAISESTAAFSGMLRDMRLLLDQDPSRRKAAAVRALQQEGERRPVRTLWHLFKSVMSAVMGLVTALTGLAVLFLEIHRLFFSQPVAPRWYERPTIGHIKDRPVVEARQPRLVQPPGMDAGAPKPAVAPAATAEVSAETRAVTGRTPGGEVNREASRDVAGTRIFSREGPAVTADASKELPGSGKARAPSVVAEPRPDLDAFVKPSRPIEPGDRIASDCSVLALLESTEPCGTGVVDAHQFHSWSPEAAYVVETVEGERWAELVREGRLAESRAYLEQNFDRVSASGKIALVSMIEHGIAGERRPQEALALLERVVADTGDRAARFNLGMSYVFGRGTEPSPERGTALIDAALSQGFKPHEAFAHFVDGCCIQGLERFSETFKRLDIAARRGDAAAKMIKGVYLTRLIAIPPCSSRDCYAEAEKLARELRESGSRQQAAVVETALKRRDSTRELVSDLNLMERHRSSVEFGREPVVGRREADLRGIMEFMERHRAEEAERARRSDELLRSLSRQHERPSAPPHAYRPPSRPIRPR